MWIPDLVFDLGVYLELLDECSDYISIVHNATIESLSGAV